jgi:acyl-[acyl-carrier-protein]-phospholipid O-acyltransferase / long-chain-fatty-acid--[acyl-carrier-protein] ligase
MLKLFFKILLRLLYRVEVKGLENIPLAGNRVMIVANHTSFLDGLLLATSFPYRLSFAINTQISKRWFSRIIKPLVNLFVMDPTNPLSLKSLIRYVQQDEKVVIFPEGRITVTGALMKIYNGPGLVADRSGAMVLPVRIDGAQFTPFSRLRGRVRLHWFPKISLTILPPRTIRAPLEVRGRARRKYAGKALSDIMTQMMFATTNYRRTMVEGILDAMRTYGGKQKAVEDIERQPLSYRQLMMRAFILGNTIAPESARGEYVGIMLPNTVTTVVAMLGLQIHGRVPALMNFTTGLAGMRNACEVAKIRRIYTSRRFIHYARLDKVVEQLAQQVRIVYLEDLVPRIGWLARLRGAVEALFARAAYRHKSQHASCDEPAVVLFTSGSEGKPKGVVLSHANILSNGAQLATRIDFSSQDVIFNALPMFHSFGLTAGTLLPLLSGMKVFFYPTPLHYRIVPEMVYEINATIMFGTNTFLAGYARFAHPYDFYSIRYVFAGAEKLQDETRRIWSERFGVRILEGYGATETSPVLASNTAMENRAGTVGHFLPGIDFKLEAVPGVSDGGRLYVKGPNVMRGYLLADNPGIIQPPKALHGDGWYDTGDIVSIDAEGFVRIRGRAKRFAKIGGEMVSLTTVEELVTQVWPDATHAVISVPDPSKGEQLVLVTSRNGAERNEILAQARTQALAENTVPRRIVVVKQIPLLGSGKTDYPAVQQLVNAATEH